MKLRENQIYNTDFLNRSRHTPVLGVVYQLGLSTWTFAEHQSPSYQTYSDVKPTVRKPSKKSTILEGQTLDLSFPGHVYKQNIILFENLKNKNIHPVPPKIMKISVGCMKFQGASIGKVPGGPE